MFKKKMFILTLSLLIILSLVVGCSAKSSNDYSSAPQTESPEAGRPDYGPPSPEDKPSEDNSNIAPGEPGNVPNPLEPKKVITTLQLDFETTEFDKTTAHLNQIIEKYKAYVENSNISNNSYYNNKSYRYGSYTIRVPKLSVDSFKAELLGIGNMISESTSKQDVTSQYTDTESRLKVITVKEERILALLEKAEKIEDIIALENQLSNVIYEKENLKSSLISLDDKVDYSTFYLNIQETEKLSSAETVETSFGTKVMNAINNSLYSFKKTMENLTISLIYLLPFLIILGIIGFIVLKLWKRFKPKNKE